MDLLCSIDWHGMFVPNKPILETILRGSLIYLSLFVLLRVVLRRETGKIGIADLLLIVLIADAAQNGMAGEYHSVTSGIILVATLVFWNYALDWLSYRFPKLRPYLRPPPLMLVKDGRLLRENMRQELITEDELRGMLRQQGIQDFGDIKEARVESDGGVSVIQRTPPEKPNHSPKKKSD
jgi:uncharacterized membrane protein YcaP (DUF421 family)